MRNYSMKLKTFLLKSVTFEDSSLLLQTKTEFVRLTLVFGKPQHNEIARFRRMANQFSEIHSATTASSRIRQMEIFNYKQAYHPSPCCFHYPASGCLPVHTAASTSWWFFPAGTKSDYNLTTEGTHIPTHNPKTEDTDF